jgi:hypothetical protein
VILELFVLAAGTGSAAYATRVWSQGGGDSGSQPAYEPSQDYGARAGELGGFGSGREDGYAYNGSGYDDDWRAYQAAQDSDRSRVAEIDLASRHWQENNDMEARHERERLTSEDRWRSEQLSAERDHLYREHQEYMRQQSEGYARELWEERRMKEQRSWHESPYEQRLNNDYDWRDTQARLDADARYNSQASGRLAYADDRY